MEIDRTATTRFTPLADFYSDEFKSAYVAGLTYTVRPGNEKLAGLVEQWLAEGKVKILDTTTGTQPASAAGAAAVS